MDLYNLVLNLMKSRSIDARNAAKPLRLSLLAQIMANLAITPEELEKVQQMVYVNEDVRNAFVQTLRKYKHQFNEDQQNRMNHFVDHEVQEISDLEKFADMCEDLAEMDRDLRFEFNLLFGVDGIGNEVRYKNYIENLSAELHSPENYFRISDYHLAGVRSLYFEKKASTDKVYETLFKVVNEEQGELANLYRKKVYPLTYQVIEHVIKPRLTEESEMAQVNPR